MYIYIEKKYLGFLVDAFLTLEGPGTGAELTWSEAALVGVSRVGLTGAAAVFFASAEEATK